MPPDGNMKMWASSSTGPTAQAYFLSSFSEVSFLYFDFRKVKVQGKKSLAVVDDHTVPFEI